MSDLLLDFIDYFKDEGVVLGDGVDTFRDHEPSEPDAIVVIHEYAGSPKPLHDTMVHRSLQIVARDKSATAAKDKAKQLYDLVSPPDRFKQLSAGRWCQLYPRQTPFRIKVDENNRVYYGFNLGVTTN